MDIDLTYESDCCGNDFDVTPESSLQITLCFRSDPDHRSSDRTVSSAGQTPAITKSFPGSPGAQTRALQTRLSPCSLLDNCCGGQELRQASAGQQTILNPPEVPACAFGPSPPDHVDQAASCTSAALFKLFKEQQSSTHKDWAEQKDYAEAWTLQLQGRRCRPAYDTATRHHAEQQLDVIDPNLDPDSRTALERDLPAPLLPWSSSLEAYTHQLRLLEVQNRHRIALAREELDNRALAGGPGS